TRRGGPGRPGLGFEIFATLVEADQGPGRIVRARVDGQHRFHRGDKVGIRLRRDHPTLDAPRLEPVFLSVVRTNSRLIGGTAASSTPRSASKRSVQRTWPAGAGVQATAIKRASSALESFGRAPGWGAPCNASAKPTVAKRARTRATVRA